MATALLMPKQGNSVESCVILEWSKKEGETVKTGETVLEAETDKATIEVESVCDGTILKIYYPADSEVPVQKMIAVIGEPGEDISSFDAEFAAGASVEERADGDLVNEAGAAAPETVRDASYGIPESSAAVKSGDNSAVSPRARNIAAAKGVDLSTVAGSGPKGRIIERDVLTVAGQTEPLTPAAAAALVEKGLSAPVSGSGIGGRVRLQDLETAAPAAAGASQVQMPDFPGSFRDEAVRGVRKLTAARMMESLNSTAQLTHSFSAIAESLLDYRRKLKDAPEELGLGRVSINDILMFVVSRVLKEYPEFNAHWYGDSMRYFDSVHMGFACDTPKGLLVPVIRFADRLTLKALSDESARLIAACRDGKAQPDELSGASFTMSNVGAFGIDSFTPIINPPEVAILGVCSTQLKPVRTGDGIEYKDHIGFSLTYDHQANDGAPASRFCAAVIKAVENLDLYLAL
ncbi:MAG: dihydrolipoamide acetyltransferase family protein [Spirochaetales bacterium]|uniref:Dihydrolipoamide acetyltransferase component of pyruvate dehydrogenase complex n=1 Tax=Candidatus Thalassospirochaeta sargassi TaxID=3119039 RepID=A0AAJ1IGQ5_9SPIO|nr:dihydrolipoamide acetyltransferase family protein [Spirochaetales bacterium]